MIVSHATEDLTVGQAQCLHCPIVWNHRTPLTCPYLNIIPPSERGIEQFLQIGREIEIASDARKVSRESADTEIGSVSPVFESMESCWSDLLIRPYLNIIIQSMRGVEKFHRSIAFKFAADATKLSRESEVRQAQCLHCPIVWNHVGANSTHLSLS